MNIDKENDDDTEDAIENDILDAANDNDDIEGEDGAFEAANDNEEVLIVSIGEDAPDEEEEVPEGAPEWVKGLRQSNRDQKKKIKELEAREAERVTAKERVELGEKPKNEDYDFNELEKYETDLIAWHDRKRKLDADKQSVIEEEEASDKRYNDKLTAYNNNKKALKVNDFDEVEAVVTSKLSKQQQGIAIHGLEKPELFMLAVGKNQKVLDRLAAITDPIVYAVEIGMIYSKMKTTSRRSPAPETRLNGTAAIGIGSDKIMEKLERESEKTGDRTKILAYKRELRESKAS